MASIQDFEALGLRTARIVAAERLEGSDKLLKLQIDLRQEQRQLVAGIGKSYEPEALLGKTIVVATNLEPRTSMGLESQGMLLAADKEGEPVLLQPEQDVAPGTIIK